MDKVLFVQIAVPFLSIMSLIGGMMSAFWSYDKFVAGNKRVGYFALLLTIACGIFFVILIYLLMASGIKLYPTNPYWWTWRFHH